MQHVAGDRVERRERLVHEQHVAVLRERPGQRDALAHAAGQLVRRLPPEPSRRTSSSRRWASSRRSPPCRRPRRRSASSTFCAAVSHGNSAGSWNISAGRLPATCTSPWVGSSSPATRLSSVDLPQPLAPSRQTNSPGATSRDTSSRTTGPRPKRLVTPRTETAGSAVPCGAAVGRGVEVVVIGLLLVGRASGSRPGASDAEAAVGDLRLAGGLEHGVERAEVVDARRGRARSCRCRPPSRPWRSSSATRRSGPGSASRSSKDAFEHRLRQGLAGVLEDLLVDDLSAPPRSWRRPRSVASTRPASSASTTAGFFCR